MFVANEQEQKQILFPIWVWKEDKRAIPHPCPSPEKRGGGYKNRKCL